MNADKSAAEKERPRRFLIPALAFAYFSVSISNNIIPLIAVDIANTFLGPSSSIKI